MTEYEFEEFDRQTRPVEDTPAVTIQKRGFLGLNSAAYELLGAPQAVTLHFDAKKRAIGIKPAEPDKRSAAQIRKSARGNSYQITAIAFAKAYEIPVEKARRYQAKPYDENMLVIDLSQEAVDVSPKKSRGHE